MKHTLPEPKKAVLKNGEVRAAYCKRRYEEGADVKTIHAEINGPDLYAGAASKKYDISVVYKAIADLPKRGAVADGDFSEVDEAPAAAGIVLGAPAPIQTGEGALSADEIEAIRKQAREDVQAEFKAAARKELLKREKDKIKADLSLSPETNEEMVDITIHLAEFAAYIQLEMPAGPVYHHGQTYRVRRRIADTLRDIMARGWKHQAEIDGKTTNFYRERNTVISPMGITGAESLRV